MGRVVRLPVRGESGRHEAEYSDAAVALARELAAKVDGATTPAQRKELANEMYVLHEFHVFLPGLRFVEEGPPTPARGFG